VSGARVVRVVVVVFLVVVVLEDVEVFRVVVVVLDCKEMEVLLVVVCGVVVVRGMHEPSTQSPLLPLNSHASPVIGFPAKQTLLEQIPLL
jgi:hypothetical protein